MAKFFIDRPIFAWVIAIIIMLAGTLAIMKLPVAQYPTIAPPAVSISAVYPGADAQTVQDTVHPPVPYATLDDNNTYSPGRTDPTGKVTVKSGPATKMAAYDPDENPFSSMKQHKD